MARPPRVSTPTTKAFADRLSDLVQIKKSEGLSHDEISRQIGVSSGVLSEWMSDSKTASIENLAKLSKYFGVSADYLLGFAELKTPDVDIQKACELTGLSDDAIHILQESYAAEALNVLLYERSFKELLLCLSSYRDASIAERIYSRILNGTASHDALTTALNSVIENDNVPEDYINALKICIALRSNKELRQISTFHSSFSSQDVYEAYANRSLAELINTMDEDAEIAAEVVADATGINLPPSDISQYINPEK